MNQAVIKTKVIIDCDPGCDDAIALICALTSDQIDVLGITSIGGNVAPEITQKNALGICALVNKTHIPVYAGCKRPLEKAVLAKADDVHGETGVQGLILPFERAANGPTDMDAADFILKTTAENAANPITLIIIGPMTNLALAFQRDPSIVSRVKEIVTMGGAYGKPGGNITPYSEFNIFCDPLAAKIVYDNFKNIRVLPLDVTHQTLQDTSFRHWLSVQNGIIPGDYKNIETMLTGYAETYPGLSQPNVSPLHDFHTVAAILKPDLYTYESGKVDVITKGEKEGQTNLTKDTNSSTKIMTGVDRIGFFKLLMETIDISTLHMFNKDFETKHELLKHG